ncbi:SWIM zinc finger protein [Planctomycetales bacterium 10988]|nr:SWIM zinc finger protein [Planctomycetales bacterium 10988]
MNLSLAYLGKSRLTNTGGGNVMQLMPNLQRDPVAFDAALKHPLRFREAISALHDIVISDLRFQPRDKTAYFAWKKEQDNLRAQRIRQLSQANWKEIQQKQEKEISKDFEKLFEAKNKQYWQARSKFNTYLWKHDPELWRQIMPCDPVVTVSDEVVFFECFSADESSYGCLTVEREAGFGRSDEMQFGTTNVDYSWDLYHYFQSLRSYRETRLKVDPAGFGVATEGHPDYREEKIDLPPGWLRGFMQIQAAMGLPTKQVRLSREAVYSLMAFLKRNKAKTSPRALRFELLPGEFPQLVLEPWEERIVSRHSRYDGPSQEPVRIWGRRRLLALSRLLPLLDHVDVYLLGTGLPSFWVAQLGEMRLTMGLSGWTTNDWTRGSAIDLLAPPVDLQKAARDRIAQHIRQNQAVSLEELATATGIDRAECLAGLSYLAHTGQVIYDLASGVYRWRQVMSEALGEREMGPESPELVASRKLLAKGLVKNLSTQEVDSEQLLLTAKIAGCETEVLLDGEGRIKRGKCTCRHYKQYALKNGPCQHMLALRARNLQKKQTTDEKASDWYDRLVNWSNSVN